MGGFSVVGCGLGAHGLSLGKHHGRVVPFSPGYGVLFDFNDFPSGWDFFCFRFLDSVFSLVILLRHYTIVLILLG